MTNDPLKSPVVEELGKDFSAPGNAASVSAATPDGALGGIYKALPKTGWLIEISGPKWFMAGPSWNWTKDASKALRFARKADAETFGRWSHLDIATGETLSYTEHMWDCGATEAAAPEMLEALREIDAMPGYPEPIPPEWVEGLRKRFNRAQEIAAAAIAKASHLTEAQVHDE